MVDTFKIGSYNVNGLQNRSKRKQVFTVIKEHRFDITFVQEAHSTLKQAEMWQSEWGGKILYSHGISEARGVMMLFKRNFPCKFVRSYADPDGRAIIVEVEIEERLY